jgi:hypothetical protein
VYPHLRYASLLLPRGSPPFDLFDLCSMPPGAPGDGYSNLDEVSMQSNPNSHGHVPIHPSQSHLPNTMTGNQPIRNVRRAATHPPTSARPWDLVLGLEQQAQQAPLAQPARPSSASCFSLLVLLLP